MDKFMNKHSIAEREILEFMNARMPYCKFRAVSHHRRDSCFWYNIELVDGPFDAPKLQHFTLTLLDHGRSTFNGRVELNFMSSLIYDTMLDCKHWVNVTLSRGYEQSTVSKKWDKMFALYLLKGNALEIEKGRW